MQSRLISLRTRRQSSFDRHRQGLMAALRFAALCALTVVLATSQAHPASAVPQPPRPCGSLDLSSPLTQHCFPADGTASAAAVIAMRSITRKVTYIDCVLPVPKRTARLNCICMTLKGGHLLPLCCASYPSLQNRPRWGLKGVWEGSVNASDTGWNRNVHGMQQVDQGVVW